MRILAVIVAIVGSACTGVISDTSGEPGQRVLPPLPGETADELISSPIQALTLPELNAVMFDLLGGDRRPAVGVHPGDTPVFDETYELAPISGTFVEGMELIAQDAVSSALSDPVRRDRIIDCDVDDESCVDGVARSFGRRALRRPLSNAEVEEYLALYRQVEGEARGTAELGLQSIIAAMLLHPELLYHVEIGSPSASQPGFNELEGFEIGSRMSFFLWGSGPDDWLLDQAAAGVLDTAEGRADTARAMLDDERAVVQIDRFHARWMGYETLPHDPALVERMRVQTRALITRVVFEENRPWLDVFTEPETFLDDTLATHYGLPTPGSDEPVWMDVSDDDRGGLLSHGSFLSIEGKFEDTSPVQRGLMISRRLLCLVIPEPMPTPGVVVDEPPPGDGCKPERYAMHSQGGCANCHQHMDPVGMGLEQYDNLGRFRTEEPGRPECVIDGQGSVPGVGGYSGPTQLGTALMANGLDACLVTQLYRFREGRFDISSARGELDRLTERFRASNHNLVELIVELVASDIFKLRRPPTAGSMGGDDE